MGNKKKLFEIDRRDPNALKVRRNRFPFNCNLLLLLLLKSPSPLLSGHLWCRYALRVCRAMRGEGEGWPKLLPPPPAVRRQWPVLTAQCSRDCRTFAFVVCRARARVPTTSFSPDNKPQYRTLSASDDILLFVFYFFHHRIIIILLQSSLSYFYHHIKLLLQ